MLVWRAGVATALDDLPPFAHAELCRHAGGFKRKELAGHKLDEADEITRFLSCDEE